MSSYWNNMYVSETMVIYRQRNISSTCQYVSCHPKNIINWSLLHFPDILLLTGSGTYSCTGWDLIYCITYWSFFHSLTSFAHYRRWFRTAGRASSTWWSISWASLAWRTVKPLRWAQANMNVCVCVCVYARVKCTTCFNLIYLLFYFI